VFVEPAGIRLPLGLMVGATSIEYVFATYSFGDERNDVSA
jgi:hypothetical protein